MLTRLSLYHLAFLLWRKENKSYLKKKKLNKETDPADISFQCHVIIKLSSAQWSVDRDDTFLWQPKNYFFFLSFFLFAVLSWNLMSVSVKIKTSHFWQPPSLACGGEKRKRNVSPASDLCSFAGDETPLSRKHCSLASWCAENSWMGPLSALLLDGPHCHRDVRFATSQKIKRWLKRKCVCVRRCTCVFVFLVLVCMCWYLLTKQQQQQKKVEQDLHRHNSEKAYVLAANLRYHTAGGTDTPQCLFCTQTKAASWKAIHHSRRSIILKPVA